MDEDPLPFAFVGIERLGNTVEARYGYGILRTGKNEISLKVVLHCVMVFVLESGHPTHLYNNKATG